ncbi:MAG: hypothetical protein IPG80_13815 [Anaerolineales bacterium]|uniref:hypothetical protein n=1 Tax=Candidatus Villigracilis vicinus TaxID=3140679 RepID=UPI0031373761|nr:hypothetical protein [Anaerolineales bacterium]
MKNDAVLPITRAIAGVVVLFLVTAFVILFFLPDRTGSLFAWAIKPHMSSMYFGAAYLGGAWILAKTAIGKRWHRVQAVFPAVTVSDVVALCMGTLFTRHNSIHCLANSVYRFTLFDPSSLGLQPTH